MWLFVELQTRSEAEFAILRLSPNNVPLQVDIVLIDEVDVVNRRITDEVGGRVCNPTIKPQQRATAGRYSFDRRGGCG